MDAEFVDLTAENLADEHLCCIIRTKKARPGVEAKRRWLSDRLREGHVFRKLNAKGVVFIEYGASRNGMGARDWRQRERLKEILPEKGPRKPPCASRHSLPV